MDERQIRVGENQVADGVSLYTLPWLWVNTRPVANSSRCRHRQTPILDSMLTPQTTLKGLLLSTMFSELCNFAEDYLKA